MRDLYRIIDANLNRSKEGLRVCEEIARFVLENKALTAQLKDVRHALDPLARAVAPRSVLCAHRNAGGDVGKPVEGNEFSRGSLQDVLYANLQRAKESIRVLEEFGKLKSVRAARGFKSLRYRLYAIEQKLTAAAARRVCS